MRITNRSPISETDTFTVRRTINIGAPIARVWSAITEPAHISRWFGQAAFIGTGVGATGTLTWPDYGAVPVRVEAIGPPRMISYCWCNDDGAGALPATVDEQHSTVFTFTLEELPDGNQLTVVETGFETTSAPAANLESHRTGWDEELDKLTALVKATS